MIIGLKCAWFPQCMCICPFTSNTLLLLRIRFSYFLCWWRVCSKVRQSAYSNAIAAKRFRWLCVFVGRLALQKRIKFKTQKESEHEQNIKILFFCTLNLSKLQLFESFLVSLPVQRCSSEIKDKINCSSETLKSIKKIVSFFFERIVHHWQRIAM